MNIGLDIDNVMANFVHAFTKELNSIDSSFSVIEHPHNVETYFIYADPIKRTKAWEYFKQLSSDFWLNIPVMHDTVNLLTCIRNNGHNVFFVTARPQELFSTTFKWLRNNFNHILPIEDSMLSCSDNKAHTCKELKIHVFLDDSLTEYENILHDNSFTIPFLLDYPYNKKLNSLRTKSLKQFIQWINLVDQLMLKSNDGQK